MNAKKEIERRKNQIVNQVFQDICDRFIEYSAMGEDRCSFETYTLTSDVLTKLENKVKKLDSNCTIGYSEATAWTFPRLFVYWCEK